MEQEIPVAARYPAPLSHHDGAAPAALPQLFSACPVSGEGPRLSTPLCPRPAFVVLHCPKRRRAGTEGLPAGRRSSPGGRCGLLEGRGGAGRALLPLPFSGCAAAQPCTAAFFRLHFARMLESLTLENFPNCKKRLLKPRRAAPRVLLNLLFTDFLLQEAYVQFPSTSLVCSGVTQPDCSHYH